jgi:hypothetical protein
VIVVAKGPESLASPLPSRAAVGALRPGRLLHSFGEGWIGQLWRPGGGEDDGDVAVGIGVIDPWRG